MPPDPSRVINNLKRSFNKFVAEKAPGETVNFGDDSFVTDGMSSWYAIRYGNHGTRNTGMGNLIDESSPLKGFIHYVELELSAWHRDDKQKTSLGDMVDILMEIAEANSITLYDFADVENPLAIGKAYLKPEHGKFIPSSGSTGDEVLYEKEVAGFVLTMEIRMISEAA